MNKIRRFRMNPACGIYSFADSAVPRISHKTGINRTGVSRLAEPGCIDRGRQFEPAAVVHVIPGRGAWRDFARAFASLEIVRNDGGMR